jgi:hypothetical protein
MYCHLAILQVKNVMLTDAGTARGGIATIAYSSILRTKGSEEVWRLAAQDISEILPSGTLDISDIEMRPVMALLRAVTRASTGREANFRLPDATVDLVMASCFRIYGYRNAPAELIVTAARAAEALFSLQTVGHEGLNNTLSVRNCVLLYGVLVDLPLPSMTDVHIFI